LTTNFGQSSTSQHNSLAGIQGGIGGEYYHLSSTDYVGNGTGLIVRSSGAVLDGNTQITGSLLGTSSWATTAITANAISFVPLTATSASWASSSISSSYALTASFALNGVSGGSLTTGSTYPITSSWAISASWTPYIEPTSVLSASWVSASAKITTADTASYILASNIDGTVVNATQTIYATQSLNATNSVNAISASFASSSISASYAISAGTAYTINFTPLSATSASWATSSISSSYSLTASYASNVISVVDFSRGGVFFDAGGIAGTYATASSLVIWRAPFACNASQICAYRVTGSTALINVKRNGGNLLTASYTIANTGSWNVLTALQSSSFSIGDKLEITLISSSGYPTQVAIQIDMQRA
jgi:hypothetical protein